MVFTQVQTISLLKMASTFYLPDISEDLAKTIWLSCQKDIQNHNWRQMRDHTLPKVGKNAVETAFTENLKDYLTSIQASLEEEPKNIFHILRGVIKADVLRPAMNMLSTIKKKLNPLVYSVLFDSITEEMKIYLKKDRYANIYNLFSKEGVLPASLEKKEPIFTNYLEEEDGPD